MAFMIVSWQRLSAPLLRPHCLSRVAINSKPQRCWELIATRYGKKLLPLALIPKLSAVKMDYHEIIFASIKTDNNRNTACLYVNLFGVIARYYDLCGVV